ncbi:MAG: hypothetical protein IKI01_09900 [Lachnospiraceae bacterium]|nr:hypothetical protein [Lachnospiraceae bacterium]
MNRGRQTGSGPGSLGAVRSVFLREHPEFGIPDLKILNSARKPVKKKEEIQILRGIKDLEHIAPKRKALYQKEAFDGEYSDSLREKRA